MCTPYKVSGHHSLLFPVGTDCSTAHAFSASQKIVNEILPWSAFKVAILLNYPCLMSSPKYPQNLLFLPSGKNLVINDQWRALWSMFFAPWHFTRSRLIWPTGTSFKPGYLYLIFGADPGCLWTKVGLHPGQVSSSLQGHSTNTGSSWYIWLDHSFFSAAHSKARDCDSNPAAVHNVKANKIQSIIFKWSTWQKWCDLSRRFSKHHEYFK